MDDEDLTTDAVYVTETEQAYKLEVDGDEMWLPKSQVQLEGDPDEGDTVEVTIKGWLAKQRGLV